MKQKINRKRFVRYKEGAEIYSMCQSKFEQIAYFQNIENIEVIDIMDDDQVIDMYEQSHIIGLSLPEKVIPSQSMVIAKALMNRYRKQKDKTWILLWTKKAWKYLIIIIEATFSGICSSNRYW